MVAVHRGGVSQMLDVSDRSNKDIGSAGRIKANGGTVDFDHALMPASLTEQFELRAR
jgi:hypothetical protein